MRVISSVGSKGGSGKSSISLLLAWEFAKSHKSKVAVLDADVQGTCASAKALNPSAPFDVVSVANKMQVWEQGKRFDDNGYDYVIIDGNPRSLQEDPGLIEMIAKLSDLSLIISRPSPRDLKAQMKYDDLVRASTKGDIRLLWNFYQKNTGAHRDGIPEGEKLLNLKSIRTKIGLRIVYQDVGYVEGYIGEMGNVEAADEIRKLGIEVKGLLHGKK
jgi:cellulose biosynthesis protein BcsQ